MSEELLAELEDLYGAAPRDVVDTQPGALALAVRERPTRTATAPTGQRSRRRHLNPKAGIPYVIAVALLSLEALLYV
jgi:hyaluronan synthase